MLRGNPPRAEAARFGKRRFGYQAIREPVRSSDRRLAIVVGKRDGSNRAFLGMGATQFTADRQYTCSDQQETRGFWRCRGALEVAVRCKDGDAVRGSIHKSHAGSREICLNVRDFL